MPIFLGEAVDWARTAALRTVIHVRVLDIGQDEARQADCEKEVRIVAIKVSCSTFHEWESRLFPLCFELIGVHSDQIMKAIGPATFGERVDYFLASQGCFVWSGKEIRFAILPKVE